MSHPRYGRPWNALTFCKAPCSNVLRRLQKQAAALADKDAEIARLKQQLKHVTPHLPAAARSSAASSPKRSRAADSGPNSPGAPKRPSVAADGMSRDIFSEALTREALSRRLDDDADWQNLPVPESLQEALEQILVLQVRLPLPERCRPRSHLCSTR